MVLRHHFHPELPPSRRKESSLSLARLWWYPKSITGSCCRHKYHPSIIYGLIHRLLRYVKPGAPCMNYLFLMYQNCFGQENLDKILDIVPIPEWYYEGLLQGLIHFQVPKRIRGRLNLKRILLALDWCDGYSAA